MPTRPLLFVVPGTLVSNLDLEKVLHPPLLRPAFKLLSKVGLPERPLVLPLELLHKLGALPDPDRLFSDGAYVQLKRLGECQVVPLVRGGLASRRESVRVIAEALQRMIDANPGRTVIIVGQSQGGLVALELAMMFREHVVAVVLAGTPIQGVPVLDELPLRLARCFPGVEQMAVTSPSLAHVREWAAADWPLGVPLILIGSPEDSLVPLTSSLQIELPLGADKRRYVIGAACPEELADEQFLRTLAGLPHLGMCWRSGLIEVVKELRQDYSVQVPARPVRRRHLAQAA